MGVGAVKINNSNKSPKSIFEAIDNFGHDEDFQENSKSSLFLPTDAPPGSQRKMDVMQRRLELGIPIFHPNDNKVSERVNNRLLTETMAKRGRKLGGKIVNDRYTHRKSLSE
jgi:hypothetical protein